MAENKLIFNHLCQGYADDPADVSTKDPDNCKILCTQIWVRIRTIRMGIIHA